jgi:MFS family permease
VEPVLFLYMLSTFSQYALFQDLVYSKVCWTLYSPGVCEDLHAEKWATELEIVQKQSSYWILMSTVSLVIPSILIAIYLGSWSDRFGRKWPVVFPPFGGILACCVYIVLSFQHEAPVGWICLASFLSGLSGGFVSCIMSCMTYVAAISSQENRTVRISRLEAMIFLGGTVGPFLSGSMLQITGHGYAFLFMLIAYAVAFFYAIFFVNEVNENSINSNGIKADGITPPILASKGILEESVKDTEQSQRLLGNTVLDNLPDVAQSAVYVSRRSVESGEDCSTSTTTTTTSCSDEEGRNILRSSSECEAENLEISRASSCCSQYFGSSHFLSAVKTVFKERPGARRAYLLLIILASYTVMMITAGESHTMVAVGSKVLCILFEQSSNENVHELSGLLGELDVAYLFARGDPLRWTYQIYSYYFGFKYGLGTIVLLVGMPLIQHFMLRDSTICILGIFSRMAGLIMYALSTNTTIAFFG